MADVVTNPVWQVLDGNGDPVPGAKATFYDTGTTTPRTVFTNTALSVAHPSPVVADANGFMPPIYTANALKAIVTASDGSGAKTIDPMPLSRAGAAGASSISFAPSSPGVPSTNVQAAIEYVYGLVGDVSAYMKSFLGLADASAARAALSAMPASTASTGAGQVVALVSTVGGTVSLPAGGNWFFFIQLQDATSGVMTATNANVAAGGTSMGGADAGKKYIGFAWRIN